MDLVEGEGKNTYQNMVFIEATKRFLNNNDRKLLNVAEWGKR